uniref:Cytochrome c oxidase subunit 2 n=1 Tax=Mytilisepta virgata TaxID=2547956 RepID=A0A516EZK1_MYTVI|nr:cytochrome c oxidase subunit II [Mytilisepta virgata]
MYGSKVFQDWFYRDVGDALNSFYHNMMLVAVFIISLVGYFLFRINFCSVSYRSFKHQNVLEWVWTVVPMLILAVLWVPSVRNLYLMNHIGEPKWSFKAVGHQWYWTYEFVNKKYQEVVLESYMDNIDDGNFKYRLLDVDQRMVAPMNLQLRVLVSSVDVLHSFSLPSCMLKVDAIPGRMTQTPLLVDKSGVVYGQCSELCGVNHSFMPIVVEFIPVSSFLEWLKVTEV